MLVIEEDIDFQELMSIPSANALIPMYSQLLSSKEVVLTEVGHKIKAISL